jgi:hypothetical protein
MKRQHTIFVLWWALCCFHKKRVGRRYTELEFLHPVGSTGPILHFGTSGVSNIDALFFQMSTHYFSYSGGIGVNSTKTHVGTRYTKLVFLHMVGSAVHIVHFDASGA